MQKWETNETAYTPVFKRMKCQENNFLRYEQIFENNKMRKVEFTKLKNM